MDDILFMRDFDELEREKELEKVLQIVTEDPLRMQKLKTGERFLKALFYASYDRRKEKVQVETLSRKEIFRRELESVRVEKVPRQVSFIENLLPEAPEPPKNVDFPITYTLLFVNNTNLVNVRIENEAGKIVYNLIAPQLDDKVVSECKDSINLRYKFDKNILKDNNYLTKKFEKIFKKKGMVFDSRELEKIRYLIDRDWNNFGFIEGLFRDGNVLSIICDGFNKPFFVEYKNLGKIETNLVYSNEKEVVDFIKKYIKKAGGEFDHKKLNYNVKYGEFRMQVNMGEQGVSSKFILRRE
ncbi:MAG: hypothetical protein PHT54_04540 [Candidatus Nanoarchaeia archaeon]|nr:hypothetical protein [Candidatus Nanoarchaeia archaeon]